MTRVVISQPMFLPWIGLFEQIDLADVYVHYDDVQFPQGRSFTSRVQINTTQGAQWLSAPIDRKRSGRLISETYLMNTDGWRENHLQRIYHAYSKRENFPEMHILAQELYGFEAENLSEFNIFCIEKIAEFLGITTNFYRSSDLGVKGQGSDRILNICKELDACEYITGHGAKRYLDHEIFDDSNISVQYMNYAAKEWPQGNQEFNMFVTILDLIASVRSGACRDHMQSTTQYWKEFTEI